MMKYINFKKVNMQYHQLFKNISVFTIAVLISAACTNDFEELNTDPSLLLEDQLDVGLLLTKVQKKMIIDNGADPIGKYSVYAGYSATTGGLPFTAGLFANEFEISYKNLLNVAEIIRITKDDPELVNKHAIARIMRVYIFQRLTDLYGDVPYSEAVQSIDAIITQPKYDTQESIYIDMLNELKAAAAELNEERGGNYGGADLIYDGDIDKWRRFANSLRLRLALRVRYIDQSLAINQINELNGADLINGNSGNAFVTTSTDFESNQNPIYNRLIGNGGVLNEFYMGKTIIDILNDSNDPRLPVIALPTPNSVIEAETNGNPDLLVYRGRPVGLDGSAEREHYQIEDLSQIGSLYRQPVLNMPLMHYSEVCFALAEVKLVFDLGDDDADTWYKRGIRANMENYGIGASDIDDFMNTPIATLSGSEEEQLEQIISQKNVALFPSSIEAWSEWRRTGYPRILIGSMIGETNGEIPRRINYQDDEIFLNSANYQSASDRIGGDNLTTKVWWDANPNVPYEHSGNIFD